MRRLFILPVMLLGLMGSAKADCPYATQRECELHQQYQEQYRSEGTVESRVEPRSYNMPSPPPRYIVPQYNQPYVPPPPVYWEGSRVPLGWTPPPIVTPPPTNEEYYAAISAEQRARWGQRRALLNANPGADAVIAPDGSIYLYDRWTRR